MDHGRFAVKRIVGDLVEVEADCFADGTTSSLACCATGARTMTEWQETPMTALGNDRWRGEFTCRRPGRYRYTVTAWVDAFLSWRHDFARRVDADDLRVAARVGAS